MAIGMGKWSDRTITNLQSEIGENLLDQLIETETLFYVLVDGVGMSNDDAKFWALKVFKGGRVFDSSEISEISQRWKHYEMNTRQSTRFVKRHMKSSRITMIDDRPYVWEMNGFGTNQPPYISGYERGDC